MTQLLPPKKEVALALLERSNVDIYLDPRARGVVVPPQFRKEPRLILKIGLNMPVPIPDLRVDDESMSCTLSFNRSPFYCVVPWPSVFAMVGDDGRGMVWPDDVPQELSVKVAEDQPSQSTRSPGPLAAAPSPNAAAGGKGKRAARIVEAAPDSDRAGKKKGAAAKKKKDGTRPLLMALPSLPPDSPRSPQGPQGLEGAAVTPEAKPDSKRAGLRAASSVPASSGSPSDAGTKSRPKELSEPKPDSNRAAPNAASGPSGPSSRPSDDDDAAPSSPPRPAAVGPSGRPKRELPPYLRVVK